MTQPAPSPQTTAQPAAHVPLNRPRLIAPGPVEVDPRVLLELAQPQMHHRSRDAVDKLMEAREKLSRLLGDPTRP